MTHLRPCLLPPPSPPHLVSASPLPLTPLATPPSQPLPTASPPLHPASPPTAKAPPLPLPPPRSACCAALRAATALLCAWRAATHTVCASITCRTARVSGKKRVSGFWRQVAGIRHQGPAFRGGPGHGGRFRGKRDLFERQRQGWYRAGRVRQGGQWACTGGGCRHTGGSMKRNTHDTA